jgi:K+ transporter
MNEEARHYIPRSYIIMSPDFIENLDDRVPALKQMVIDRYGILPHHIIFLNVKTRKTPHVSEEERFRIIKFYDDPQKGSIVSVRIRFGFMEDKNVEQVLSDFAAREQINIDLDKHKWMINVMHERIIPELVATSTATSTLNSKPIQK